MTVFLQYVAGGLAAGSLYALVALGLTLIYKTTGVVNFAHGEMAMVSTFFAYIVLTTYHVPYIAAFGGALLFDALPFPQPIGGTPFNIGGVRVSADSILIFVLTAAIMAALYLFFRYTLLGVALRATAQNLTVARLMGVRVGRVYSTTWAVAAAMGAVSGMLFAPTTALYPGFMGDIAIKGFTGAIIGGLGNLPGAVLGGLVLGVLENLIAGYISTELKAFFAFSLILLVLVARPEGIMGAPVRRRI